MDKALELLEKHCQWLAVGLGGLFLAWMLWSYVLLTPVAVVDKGATYTPADVDTTIAHDHADPLKVAMDRQTPPTPPDKAGEVPQIEQPPASNLEPISAVVIDSPTTDVTKIDPEKKGGPIAVVNALPTVPPTQIAEAVSRRAFVQPPQPAGGQPPQPAPGAPAGAAAAAGPAPHDLVYVRVSYNIDPAKIDQAFEAAQVPANSRNTAVIATHLWRQEQLPDGKWADAVEVPWVKTATVYPPPAGNDVNAVNNFRNWVDSGDGQTALLRPPFYAVTYGEGPWDPSMDALLPKYDPDAIAKERKRIADEREQQRRAAIPRTPTPTPSHSSRRGAAGGSPVVADPQRPTDLSGLVGQQLAQATPAPELRRAAPPAGTTPPAGAAAPTPDATPDQPPVAPGQGQPPAAAQVALPGQTGFIPNGQPPIFGWAFDETVAEGHTYRYQVTYSLRNPIYLSNFSNNAALVNQFEIKGEIDANAWSDAVTVKPSAEYYLASNNWTENTIPATVQVLVFKWAQGKWQMETFQVAPGDRIGGEKNGVDFSTNVTVVDLRYDARGTSPSGQRGRAFVLMLTPDGRLVEREPTADRNDIRMNQLKMAVAANAGGAAPGAPGAGGMPPGNPGAP